MPAGRPPQNVMMSASAAPILPPAAARPESCVVADPLTPQQALQLLELSSSAHRDAVKRAYRQLARRHHPDVGGDPAVFQRLHEAVQLLLDGSPVESTPPVARGRPSRRVAAWDAGHDVSHEPVDLDSVDWRRPRPAPGDRLDRDLLALHLADGEEPLITTLRAISRAPGSRLNPVADRLSPDLTAHLTIRTDRDDRGRAVVLLELVGAHRKARRALDRVPLEGTWLRVRGSSTTRLRMTLAPSSERQGTAVRAADRTADMLEHLAWPLAAWTCAR